MMQDKLKIALVQTDLYWQDAGANRSMLEEKLWAIHEPLDLIVLPEMFTTGFSMDVEPLAEPMNFSTCRWMKQMAAQTGAVITGSLIIQESGNFFNRLLWVRPDGEISHYDKRHLFRMAGEDNHFSMGNTNVVLELKGWRVLPQICYDLRFPVWTRNKMEKDGRMTYDLLFYIASWPAPRAKAWDILLKARAVENSSYSIGVNRIGIDGNHVEYSGHSGLYDFKGDTLAFLNSEEKTEIQTIDYKTLTDYREKFPVWKDADAFEL